MWESKTSFNEIREWVYLRTETNREGHQVLIYGEKVTHTFSDPKPVMATLGFTLEGQLGLAYSWMGGTASTQPHTAGSASVNLMPLQSKPGGWGCNGWPCPKDQNLQPCSDFPPPYRVTVTGEQ